MRLTRLHHLSFALALLLGQLLAFAHGFEHRALTPEATCQLCVHAPGLQSGATAPTSTLVLLDHGVEAPSNLATPSLAAPRQAAYRSRAPPLSLV